ncbi:unnamed protein product [Spirodela intermedia]|uniref:Uncharacterized protein n=1 Tax=Spirodela intermedia TaxID=51605 RepID=A0A7I8IKJ3_SPIIN|nr:unnamed protein product [Spirodela intermedia]CAA6657517.1 unnamed protein product [Spirodela intermedia]
MSRHRHFLASAGGALLFVLSCLVALAFVASLFARLNSYPRYSYASSNPNSTGCNLDGEGSWSVGVFYGDSRFPSSPSSRNSSTACPVANPVFTCASTSDAGSPSNFIADPFLYIDGSSLYLFFETKNSITMQGDIGVAKSSDNGSTWEHLGIILDEEWHLSYPFVFNYRGQIYLMPEGSKKGDLRLYRAVDFPLKWILEKVILDRPLIDTFMVNYQGMYWLFGSDWRGSGVIKNGQLEIWYSSSPFGPWKPHGRNPIHNMDKSLGARNAGRPFVYNGSLYRPGQDCGETYGRRVRLFEILSLTVDEYREIEVPLGIEEPKKGRNAWNGARYHQLDAQQLPSGEWIAVMDGDRVPSGENLRRLIIGYSLIAAAVALVVLAGAVLCVLKCLLRRGSSLPQSGTPDDGLAAATKALPLLSCILVGLLGLLKKLSWSSKSKVGVRACVGRLVLGVALLSAVVIVCTGVYYLRRGNGVEEAYPWKGQYSQFTLLTMASDAYPRNLRKLVKHYSRCPSVGEIVIVWNKGQPPPAGDFHHSANSLNNRFKADPLIKNRGVLQLEFGAMVGCNDLERGFKVWRQYPDRIVGFFPGLADGNPGYNMILAGAAFVDGQLASGRYWSEEAISGRKIVDRFSDCEDILMNFLFANMSSSSTAEFVRPAEAMDPWELSGSPVGRGRGMARASPARMNCLIEFSKTYGSRLAGRKSEFGRREDGWDV